MNVKHTLTAAIAVLGLGAAAGFGLAHTGASGSAATGTASPAAAHARAAGAGAAAAIDHAGHGAGPVRAQSAPAGIGHGSDRAPGHGRADGGGHGAGDGRRGGMGGSMGHGMGHGMGGGGPAAGHGTGHAPGQSMGGGMGMGMGMGMTRLQPDEGSQADLALVHTMVHGASSITRTVTDLPDGIRTLTESNDPQVAAALQAHVGSMMQRLEQGREFNLFSDTIPVLFANRDRIVTRFEVTPRGASVVQTSRDPAVVAALQAHAREVSELAREGPVAMQRNMQREMARNSRGPARTSDATGASRAATVPAQGHAH